MQEPNHNQAPKASHNNDHNASGHNGKVPSPSYSQIPISIHIHQTKPNDLSFCRDEIHVPHWDAIHNHNADRTSMIHMATGYHRRTGNLLILLPVLLIEAMKCI